MEDGPKGNYQVKPARLVGYGAQAHTMAGESGRSEPALLLDMDTLCSAIAEHEEALSMLHAKLSTITLAAPPEPTGPGNAAPRVMRSDYGNNMLDQIDRIRRLSIGIGSLLSRLEV